MLGNCFVAFRVRSLRREEGPFSSAGPALIPKERDAKPQVLVPLNLDGYLFSDKWKSGYQAQIRGRLAADFTESGTDSTKFDAQVERLIRALRANEGAREKPPKGKL